MAHILYKMHSSCIKIHLIFSDHNNSAFLFYWYVESNMHNIILFLSRKYRRLCSLLILGNGITFEEKLAFNHTEFIYLACSDQGVIISVWTSKIQTKQLKLFITPVIISSNVVWTTSKISSSLFARSSYIVLHHQPELVSQITNLEHSVDVLIHSMRTLSSQDGPCYLYNVSITWPTKLISYSHDKGHISSVFHEKPWQ